MLLETIIRKLKRDPGYKWESSYSFKELATIVGVRLRQMMRGSVKRLFFMESRGLVFVGSDVTIRHPYLFAAGENLILGDHTFIDALSVDGISLKDNVSLGRNCTLICTGVIAQRGQGISIGNNTGINANAFLGGQGGIIIEDNVIIGPGVQIFSENHNFTHPQILIKEQGVSRGCVCIESNCWIGANVVVLAGVTIGEGSVIAAGSVVTKSVPPFSVAAGIPARVTKRRVEDDRDENIIALNASA